MQTWPLSRRGRPTPLPAPPLCLFRFLVLGEPGVPPPPTGHPTCLKSLPLSGAPPTLARAQVLPCPNPLASTQTLRVRV